MYENNKHVNKIFSTGGGAFGVFLKSNQINRVAKISKTESMLRIIEIYKGIIVTIQIQKQNTFIYGRRGVYRNLRVVGERFINNSSDVSNNIK